MCGTHTISDTRIKVHVLVWVRKNQTRIGFIFKTKIYYLEKLEFKTQKLHNPFPTPQSITIGNSKTWSKLQDQNIKANVAME
jgi:hypothetical protein